MKRERSGFGIRSAAGVLDGLLGVIVALLLAGTTGGWFAGRAVATLSIGSPDTLWRGPIPMIMGIFGSFFYGLPFALLLVLLSEALLDASPGKWLLRLRVVEVRGEPAPVGRRLLRWSVKCSGVWIMTLALVAGSLPLALAAVVAAVAVLAGSFMVTRSSRLAFHDRISGTAVWPASA